MDSSILVSVLVGFIAQLIDGALGMAYGVLIVILSIRTICVAGILPLLLK